MAIISLYAIYALIYNNKRRIGTLLALLVLMSLAAGFYWAFINTNRIVLRSPDLITIVAEVIVIMFLTYALFIKKRRYGALLVSTLIIVYSSDIYFTFVKNNNYVLSIVWLLLHVVAHLFLAYSFIIFKPMLLDVDTKNIIMKVILIIVASGIILAETIYIKILIFMITTFYEKVIT